MQLSAIASAPLVICAFKGTPYAQDDFFKEELLDRLAGVVRGILERTDVPSSLGDIQPGECAKRIPDGIEVHTIKDYLLGRSPSVSWPFRHVISF
jgi:hypothetical protein